MKTVKYTGSCHCGAIRFRFLSPQIESGMRCNCSICKRKGALMTSFPIPPKDLQVDDDEGLLSTYRFDDAIAKHHFCDRCGIFTFVATRLKPGHFRVNLGCVDSLDSFSVPETLFDGKQI